MPTTSTTYGAYGAYAAAELIAAKAAGRSFKKDELAAFLDLLLHDWQQRMPQALALAQEPAKIDAEAIYQAYPRKIGKQAALKAIRAAIKQVDRSGPLDGHDSAGSYLLERVQTYAAAVAQWPARDQEFVPHPATWFNRGSYLDDPREWQAKGARAAGPAAPSRDYSKI